MILPVLIAMMASWINRRQQQVIAYSALNSVIDASVSPMPNAIVSLSSPFRLVANASNPLLLWDIIIQN